MNNRGIFNRAKRAYSCQKKHLYSFLWRHCSPELFWSHPKLISVLWYASQTDHLPNLRKPTDFNELLIRINLEAYHDELVRYTRIQCTDKYAVREYVERKGLGSILNDCYGVYDKFEDIDFNSLPDKFVVKLTSGCGQNFICKDKSSINLFALQSLFNSWIKESSSFGLSTAEWHYSLIKPRIIIEKYLSTKGEDTSLIDYKFHCIKGKVAGILVCYDRDPVTHQASFDYYDTNWNLTNGIRPQYHREQRVIPKPKSFYHMMEIAERISEGIDYVRVDLYEIDDRPIFGEMTFTPAGNVMMRYSDWTLKDLLKRYLETID